MALRLECSNCLHVQLVGLIDNGLSGFPDPHSRCEGCGQVGTFHYLPGWHDRYTPTLAAQARKRTGAH